MFLIQLLVPKQIVLDIQNDIYPKVEIQYSDNVSEFITDNYSFSTYQSEALRSDHPFNNKILEEAINRVCKRLASFINLKELDICWIEKYTSANVFSLASTNDKHLDTFQFSFRIYSYVDIYGNSYYKLKQSNSKIII